MKQYPQLSHRSEWASRQRIGYLMQQGVDYPDCLSLAAGLVDYATLPGSLVAESLQRILSDSDRSQVALQYGTTPGSLRLRQLLMQHLAKLDGIDAEHSGISLDQLLVTTGSQQFLDLVSQAMLDPGDICLVTSPSYFVYLSTLEGMGAEIVSVNCDDDGIIPQSLDETLSQLEEAGKLPRVKLLYLVSYFDNPRGRTMSTERRADVLEVLQRWEGRQFITLLEDAAYRELWFEAPPPASFWSMDQTRDRVIYTQTFSKSLSPGLRTAFGVLPKRLVKAVDDLKSIHDFGSPHLSQAVVADLLETKAYDQHVADLREAYRIKAETTWQAIRENLLTTPAVHAVKPAGGLYVWLKISGDPCDTRFQGTLFSKAAEDHRVMYVPGELFYGDESHPEASATMRLSYGVQPTEHLSEGSPD